MTTIPGRNGRNFEGEDFSCTVHRYRKEKFNYWTFDCSYRRTGVSFGAVMRCLVEWCSFHTSNESACSTQRISAQKTTPLTFARKLHSRKTFSFAITWFITEHVKKKQGSTFVCVFGTSVFTVSLLSRWMPTLGMIYILNEKKTWRTDVQFVN